MKKLIFGLFLLFLTTGCTAADWGAIMAGFSEGMSQGGTYGNSYGAPRNYYGAPQLAMPKPGEGPRYR